MEGCFNPPSSASSPVFLHDMFYVQNTQSGRQNDEGLNVVHSCTECCGPGQGEQPSWEGCTPVECWLTLLPQCFLWDDMPCISLTSQCHMWLSQCPVFLILTWLSGVCHLPYLPPTFLPGTTTLFYILCLSCWFSSSPSKRLLPVAPSCPWHCCV